MNRTTRSINKALHHAVDGGDIEVARALLDVMETLLERTPDSASQRRWMREAVVAGWERIWALKHSGGEN